MIKIPNTTEKYRQKIDDYEELAERVDYILFEILDLEKINYALTENRVKSMDSFQTKIKNLKDDKKEFYDLAGIRAVGYVRSDVEKIIKIIQENFNVDEDKSKDKASELKLDQFGYRATHLICTLPDRRTILPEYKKFKGMYFEIQVKTILEHAWAQIEHDRNYKYKGIPKDIQHDFYLAAGILETADNQFESINKRIETFDKSIKKKTQEGKLQEIELNPATLKRYLIDKFSTELTLDPSYGNAQDGISEVEELSEMGIKNMRQLEEVLPKNLPDIEKAYVEISEFRHDLINLSAIVFTILFVSFGSKASKVLCKTRNMTQEKFNEYLVKFQSISNKLTS